MIFHFALLSPKNNLNVNDNMTPPIIKGNGLCDRNMKTSLKYFVLAVQGW